MRRRLALVLAACLATCCASPFAAHADSAADGDQAAGSLGLDPRTLAGIRPLAEEAIASGETSGCVVCIGRRDGIAWLECFGDRQVEPVREPMTRDTMFDLASLTKPVATATAVMQLVDDSLLQLDDPVAQHLPAFAAHGKEAITVRDLLTHTRRPDRRQSARRLRARPSRSLGPNLPPHAAGRPRRAVHLFRRRTSSCSAGWWKPSATARWPTSLPSGSSRRWA